MISTKEKATVPLRINCRRRKKKKSNELNIPRKCKGTLKYLV